MRILTPAWRHARYIRAINRRPSSHGLFELDGRRALVTGGAHGIGAALVRQLATAGSRVVSIDPSTPAVPVDGAEYLLGDVRTFEFDQLEPVDLVVANAGVVDSSPSGILDDEDLGRIVGINVTGFVRTLATPRTTDGRAVVVCSRSAVSAQVDGLVYGATKAAALNLAYSFGTLCPTTVAIVGITATKLFEAEAVYHGRPVPTLGPGMARPAEVARQVVAAVRAGRECVVTDPLALRDVAAYSHWIASARLVPDPRRGS